MFRYLSVPRQTKEKERELFLRMRGGDIEARDQILWSLSKLLFTWVRDVRRNVDFEMDLLHDAWLIVFRALEKFETGRADQVWFSTYLCDYAPKVLASQNQKYASILSLGFGTVEAYTKLRVLEREFLKMHGREPHISELAVLGKMTVHRAKKILAIARKWVSLDVEEAKWQNAPRRMRKYLASYRIEAARDTHDRYEERSFQEILSRAPLDMEPQLRMAILMYYGLDGMRKRTLEEIGERFGCSREYVRQRINKALKHLRHPRRFQYLYDFYVQYPEV